MTAAEPQPGRRELREFGLIFGGMVALIFGLVLPWALDGAIPRWPWIVLGAFVLIAITAPLVLGPVYKLWMAFGRIMSKITTPIILGSVFYLVVTPMGIIRRLVAADPLQRRWDPESASYRKQSETPPADQLEKPF